MTFEKEIKPSEFMENYDFTYEDLDKRFIDRKKVEEAIDKKVNLCKRKIISNKDDALFVEMCEVTIQELEELKKELNIKCMK